MHTRRSTACHTHSFICHPPKIRELPTQICATLRPQVLVRYRHPCGHVSHVGFVCYTEFNVVMSDPNTAAPGTTAAPGGLAVKPDSAPNTQSANTAINAASNQGYLSKLLGSGFGFGSGTAPTAGRTLDEAHEYHPGK